MAFRKSLPANSFSEEDEDSASYGKAESIGSAGSLALRSSSGRSSSTTDAADGLPAAFPSQPPTTNKSCYKAVAVFLSTLGLDEWMSLFEDERIDVSALYLIEDEDLIQMGVPTGPRKKILKALSEMRHDMDHPPAITDSKL